MVVGVGALAYGACLKVEDVSRIEVNASRVNGRSTCLYVLEARDTCQSKRGMH